MVSEWANELFTERNLLFLLCAICFAGFASLIKMVAVAGDSVLGRLRAIEDSLSQRLAQAMGSAEHERKKDQDSLFEREPGSPVKGGQSGIREPVVFSVDAQTMALVEEIRSKRAGPSSQEI